MKDPILLICISCLRKTRDYNLSSKCNVHYDHPIYTFMCLICGNEVRFVAELVKTKSLTIKKKKSILNKIEVLRSLKKTNRIND